VCPKRPPPEKCFLPFTLNLNPFLEIKMKRSFKNALSLAALFSLAATPAFAAGQAGLGFVFGTSFQQHQKSTFKQGSANYYRIAFFGDKDGTFFLHNEQSFFNVEQGDARTVAMENTQGIGVSLPLMDILSLEVIVGGSSVAVPAAASTSGGTDAVAGGRSTDSIADLGVKWNKTTGRVQLGVALSMRQHKMSSGFTVTDSSANTSTVNDLSSTNLAIDVAYNF